MDVTTSTSYLLDYTMKTLDFKAVNDVILFISLVSYVTFPIF
jgi:hypothetical protein